jgi:hypothetical protein
MRQILPNTFQVIFPFYRLAKDSCGHGDLDSCAVRPQMIAVTLSVSEEEALHTKV